MMRVLRPVLSRLSRVAPELCHVVLPACALALSLAGAQAVRAEFAGAGPGGMIAADAIPATAPDAAMAADLFGADAPVTLHRATDGVPGWAVIAPDGVPLGFIGSTWEIAGSVGYSGRPLDVLVAIDMHARIAGARLMRHSEPVLTLGISEADIAAFVGGFAGLDIAAPRDALLGPVAGAPDVIARATVSTGVIRDGILRTARTLAIGRGLIADGAGIDRLGYAPADWDALIAEGALVSTRVSMAQAAGGLSGAKVPVQPSEAPFLEVWAGLIDPPEVGQNLLGQQLFTQAVGALGPRDAALVVLSRGLYSHRGTDWRRSGAFERITIVQGETRHHPAATDYLMVRRLAITGAPEVKEISVFRLPGAVIDPTRPFTVEITATRPAAAGGEVGFATVLDYSLPDRWRLAPPAAPEPLWQAIWAAKRPQAIAVAGLLGALTLILFAQEWIVHRPRLWARLRVGFLATTLLGLGWGLNGQLSVVQVVAFVQSLLTGFRWETFLIEPVIFLLWSFVALGLLFWGRGVFCGWLCPFGALQELLNTAARRIGIRQIAVPQALHERLWVIKYTLFVAILALSFYSLHDALVLAEAEPFKTVISLRFLRAWPFVLFALALLGAGLFIERFYCRYLCPLGAALAIPAKLKIFDWLKRRPQCGRECRFCETRCTVGAIDPLGRINPNECVLCLRCQVIQHDETACMILKRRARAARPASEQTP
ncbi:4Fe-4S binding protein [Thioclava sp. GXIMD4215]|uniref:4Fe-4S binding protein n=1 Tax=Thioclava sp. GXIMD4215 TaxID=3131928 RepID=UPI00311AD577